MNTWGTAIVMRMTLSSLYLHATLVVLSTLGFERSDALNALKLREDDLSDKSTRIEVDRLIDLFNAAEAQTGDTNIGLRTGHRFRINAFSRTGAVYGYCKDLAQVIQMNSRYQKLAIDIGSVSHVQTADGGNRMQLDLYYSDHACYRHVTDLVMGAYGTAYRWLSWGSGEDLLGVDLPYPTPASTDLHARVFQCPVDFGQDSAGLEFSTVAMSAPLTTHDPERHAKLQAELDALLGAREAAASLRHAVETTVRGAMLGGRLSAELVSERMGKSWRDLRAQLAESDVRYRDLVDGVRQDVFLELNAQGESFAAIAQALGYNDQAAFNRAFKRWYGMTPTQWRKGQPDI